jgi:hypothetical protein
MKTTLRQQHYQSESGGFFFSRGKKSKLEAPGTGVKSILYPKLIFQVLQYVIYLTSGWNVSSVIPST